MTIRPRFVLAYIALGSILGVPVGLLAGGTVFPPVKRVVYDVPITKESSREEVVRHFHLGTIRPGDTAYDTTQAIPNGNIFNYKGGRTPERWQIILVIEDHDAPPPMAPAQIPGS